MRLTLITTTHYVLAVDDEGRFYRIHSGKGLYYGLTRNKEYVYVTCRGTTAGLYDPEIRAQENGSILVFDTRRLALVDELYCPDFRLRDVHGAACINGQLFVACSYDNLIAIHDLSTGQWKRWYPAIDPQARGCDVNHFNTVAAHENRLAVLAHNNGSSQLLIYDPCSFDLCRVEQFGQQAHDIFCVDGKLGVCSSAEGLLVSTSGWKLRTGGFPRGVSFTGESIMVGISQIATRAERSQASAVLRCFDRTWHYQRDYILENVGMVLDILSIDVGDRLSGKFHPFLGIRSFTKTYNDLAPGNIYYPGSANGRSGVFAPEWHQPEGLHRWTGACEARMKIVVNPGEQTLSVAALSAFPGGYYMEVFVDQRYIGRVTWTQPEHRTEHFALREGSRACELSFRVPHLWQPSKYLPGSQDDRKIGIGIAAVTLQ